ncbi:haloacid dehalogenase type II [Veronia pacifica]|nr:haloacid dehalogenase type II [Veronia pacifica]
MITLAFDVYGTLINTQGVVTLLEKMVGDKADDFSRSWRNKQLEYSFRRGLMKQYAPFSQCTIDALDYTCNLFNEDLTSTERKKLIEAYDELPPFDDVIPCLKQLATRPVRLFAFSNGQFAAVKKLLDHAEILPLLIDIISVDEVQSFKPDPAVYHYFLRQSGSKEDQSWLISSNPFDVIGASHAGIKSIWLKREQNSLLDPWDIKPELTIDNLCALKDIIDDLTSSQI